jgi:hypothetical protein
MRRVRQAVAKSGAELPDIDEDTRNLDAEAPDVDGDTRNLDVEVPISTGTRATSTPRFRMSTGTCATSAPRFRMSTGTRATPAPRFRMSTATGRTSAARFRGSAGTCAPPGIAVPQANGQAIATSTGIELAATCRDTPGMKPSIALRLLACLALLLACAPALAKPALWVVKDADTTIYLFGTVHLLPTDTDWHYPALDRAVADSRTLYIELTDDDQANMTALVLRYGLDPAHPLSSLLSQSEQLRLRMAANKAGVPGGLQALNVMRPWLAALTLATAPLLKAGLDPEHGVDKQLKAQMSGAGKQVLGLETAEQQIRFLADMPKSVELAFLRSTMREVDKGPIELTDLIDAWKSGDIATIARLEDEEMRQTEPKLYQLLLVQRNEIWATKVATMLQQPGTVFIAVGAAHLAGPDSVQAQLRRLGIDAVRQ